jgi:2-dehydro-3-deoxy-D-arabinonate dehydratase
MAIYQWARASVKPASNITMRLCRFTRREANVEVGLWLEDHRLVSLRPLGLESLCEVLEKDNPSDFLKSLRTKPLTPIEPSEVTLLAPVESQEIWAAGVTYQRSKKARMEESDFSATAYDRVYEAARPELFFKSLASKVSGPRQLVGMRRDSKWNVPEPELALVINSRGRVVGYTVGNDMSSRDIEGENLLYLPQAKIYRHSCALGPCIRVGVDETEARSWEITLTIRRNAHPVFTGQTNVGNIKRSFEELVAYLFQCQDFPQGAVLLTGTGIVPPNDFTLRAGDEVSIGIDGVGELSNPVVVV